MRSITYLFWLLDFPLFCWKLKKNVPFYGSQTQFSWKYCLPKLYSTTWLDVFFLYSKTNSIPMRNVIDTARALDWPFMLRGSHLIGALFCINAFFSPLWLVEFIKRVADGGGVLSRRYSDRLTSDQKANRLINFFLSSSLRTNRKSFKGLKWNY